MAHSASLARYERPGQFFWDDQNYRGDAYAAFAWAVYVAEVTVDLTTYGVTVDDFVALQEVGKSAASRAGERADRGRRGPGNRLRTV